MSGSRDVFACLSIAVVGSYWPGPRGHRQLFRNCCVSPSVPSLHLCVCLCHSPIEYSTRMLLFMPFILKVQWLMWNPLVTELLSPRAERNTLQDIIYLLNAAYRRENIFISWIFEKVVYTYVSFDDSSEHTFMALICRGKLTCRKWPGVFSPTNALRTDTWFIVKCIGNKWKPL